MERPTEAPAGLPRRRRTYQCSECDEVFVDEDSLARHELTHRPPPPPEESGDADDPEERPAPRRGRGLGGGGAAPASGAGSAGPAETRGAPVMPLSAVRQAAGIEPTGELLSRPDGLGFDDPGSLEMEGSAYRPLGWEAEKSQSKNPIVALYTAVEDFSEFLFRGLQKMFGAVGLTLVPAIGLALRGIILLLLGLCLLFAGMWVGRKYGPLLRGRPAPVSRNVPPTRPSNPGLDSAKQARQAVLEFYAAIDSGRYQVAYNQLTPAWKRELSYAQFEKGFRSTQRVRCLVDEVRQVGESIELDVTLEATESGILRRYQGTYVAEHTANGWKLDSGSFRQ